jgi:hypothetical protein
MIRYTTNVDRHAALQHPVPEPRALPSQAEPAAPSDPTLADDLLRGADAIATFVFGSPKHRRKVYYYATDAKMRMPVFRIGAIICARKSTLIEWIERQEQVG